MSICSVLTACIHLSLVLYGCLYIVLINSSIQISQFPTAWKQTTCDAGLANRYCKECTEMGRCVNLVLTDTTLALSSCRKITRSRKWEKKIHIISTRKSYYSSFEKITQMNKHDEHKQIREILQFICTWSACRTPVLCGRWDLQIPERSFSKIDKRVILWDQMSTWSVDWRKVTIY